jgi:Bacterial aa3 type cytochrome c oxidase subunit IV
MGHGMETRMAEYERGNMDIGEHEKTFEGFIKFWIYLSAAVIVVLIFLAMFYT